MKFIVTLTALVLALPLASRRVDAESTPSPASASTVQSDPLMGEYAGIYSAVGNEPRPAEARVVAWGHGIYRVMARAVDSTTATWPLVLEFYGKREGDRLALAAEAGGVAWQGEVQSGKLAIEAPGHYGGKFTLERINRQSPTLGQEPPANAIILLPFEGGKAPSLEAWANKAWSAEPDGSMRVGKGTNLSVGEFGSMDLHLEFMLPYEPDKRDQDRGNSGVYLQNRYEVQVLDTFGIVPRLGDCGAVYGIRAPPVNVSLPPLAWQTYDISFRAPELGPNGELLARPRLTVRLNGVLLHAELELPGPTGGGAPGFAARGPIALQDHGHEVRYRNIWLVETK